MKFFNIDQHATVIADISYIFKNLGHQVDDLSISGHHWVMGKSKGKPMLSDGSHLTCSGVCSQEVCDMFYEQNKNELNKYDAFITCYPTEFALLYEKWNKPIIVVNCIRYDHPNTFNPNLRTRLTEFLKQKNDEGKLYLVCANRGDQFYTKYFTGINGMHIPSLCEYTEHKYTGTKNKYVLHDRSMNVGISHDLFFSLGQIRNSSWRYTWEDLYSYKGVIHVPYQNGTVSIFEQYTANVPLFFPTKRYSKELFHQGNSFSDLTFYKIEKQLEPAELDNPNSLRNPEILDKWLDTSDFYDVDNLKHIQYFDSPSHLEYLLKTVNTKEISQKMAEYNVLRKKSAYMHWKEILDSIERQK